MSILLTGASGFIGSRVHETLYRAGMEVVSFSGDIRNRCEWEKQALVGKCDTIIHLAAQTSLSYAENNVLEDFGINFIGTSNGVELGCRFFLASTVTVEGLTDSANPQSECLDPAPITVYDAHKLASEKIVTASGGTVYRFSNVYGYSLGQSNPSRGIVNQFVLKGLGGEAIRVYRSVSDKYRDYVHIDDVVRAIMKWAARPSFRGGVYNVCSGQRHTVLSMAQMCGETEIVEDPEYLHPIDRRSWVGSYAKIERECGWFPAIPLRNGIEMTKNEYRRAQ